MKKEYIFIVILVAAIIVGSFVAFNFVQSKSTSDSQVLKLGVYEKVTSNDLISNNQNHIYFISWYGCPIGADNSWVLYDLINSSMNGNGTQYVIPHQSIANTPGLLFLKGKPYDNIGENFTFSYAGVPFCFTSIYLYNQTLTGMYNNQSFGNISKNTYNISRIDDGLALLQKYLPSSVYNVAKQYETEIPLENHTESIANLSGHLVTMLIITGPDGTFVHFFFMFPSFSSGVMASTVLSDYMKNQQIQSAEQELILIMGEADTACA
ncbi:DUF929 family protein [Caldiplasma sukawensis]